MNETHRSYEPYESHSCLSRIYPLSRRVFVVVEHRRLFAQQPGVGVKLSAMMPVFVVSECEILPNGEHAVRRLELARQVFVSQRGQRIVSGLMTFARVFLAIGDGLQSRRYRLALLRLRYVFVQNLLSELPLLDSLAYRLLASVNVQDQVAH